MVLFANIKVLSPSTLKFYKCLLVIPSCLWEGANSFSMIESAPFV